MSVEAETGDTREWGPWSVWKTEVLLKGYLNRFVTASQRSMHRTFIDCFAGAAANVARKTGQPVSSSPKLALSAGPPVFTHVLCFELPDRADALQTALQTEFPGRALQVVAGDCNDVLDSGLDWWAGQGGSSPDVGPHLGATLAYVDPNKHQDLAWTTVERLASAFGTSDGVRKKVRKGPIEQLILFPLLSIKRTLTLSDGKYPDNDKQAELDRFFGTSEWKAIYDCHRKGQLGDGNEAWLWYLDLYRASLEALGYGHTQAVEVRNTQNGILYFMVFATANKAGEDIMSWLVDNVKADLPRLIREEKDFVKQLAELERDALFAFEKDPALAPTWLPRLVRGKPRRFDPTKLPKPKPEQPTLF